MQMTANKCHERNLPHIHRQDSEAANCDRKPKLSALRKRRDGARVTPTRSASDAGSASRKVVKALPPSLVAPAVSVEVEHAAVERLTRQVSGVPVAHCCEDCLYGNRKNSDDNCLNGPPVPLKN